jgi:hypothetical protein
VERGGGAVHGSDVIRAVDNRLDCTRLVWSRNILDHASGRVWIDAGSNFPPVRAGRPMHPIPPQGSQTCHLIREGALVTRERASEGRARPAGG